MILLKLCVILSVIVVILLLKKPLYAAILAGVATVILLCRISPATALSLAARGITNRETIVVVSVLYLITYLQRLLEMRAQLQEAQRDLNGIFGNRRINATLAPVFIGLLPSAAAVNICADIVDDACGEDLNRDEKTFVASYYRHIPESFLPTYPSVLLMAGLGGVPLSGFVGGMLPLVAVLYGLGYVFYLRKVPRATGIASPYGKMQSLRRLFEHLWSLFLIVALILVFNLPIYLAVLGAIILSIFVYKFKWSELRPVFKSAVEKQMLLNSVLVMVFREFIQYSHTIEALPEVFSFLPVPPYMIFALIFFIGALMIGNNAIVAMTASMAFAAIPGSGVPLAILLISFTYAAMQISPTHYCLFIAIDHFHSDYSALVKKTVLPVLLFCTAAVVYYNVLTWMVERWL